MVLASFSSADPNAYVAIGMQSAQGTPQTTVAKFRFAKYLSGNSFNVNPAVVDLREGGDGLNYGFTYKTGIEVAGTLVFNMRPEFLGQVLQFLPGGATWDGASAPSAHTFHDNHASLPWTTFQIAHPGTDLVHLFSDARFLGFTLEAQAGQPLRLTLPFKAITLGASTGIALVPTAYQEDPFLYHAVPSYVVDGTGDSTIESWRLECRLGTEDLRAQAITLDDIVVQNRDYDFQFTRRYQNSTLWKKIAYGGGVTPTSSVPTGSFQSVNVYGAAASLRSLQMDLGLLTYRSNQISELNPDGQTVRETVMAKPLKTASAAVRFILKNGHASAYAP